MWDVICNEVVSFRPYCAGVATRTRNVSEYTLVLALCLVLLNCYQYFILLLVILYCPLVHVSYKALIINILLIAFFTDFTIIMGSYFELCVFVSSLLS